MILIRGGCVVPSFILPFNVSVQNVFFYFARLLSTLWSYFTIVSVVSSGDGLQIVKLSKEKMRIKIVPSVGNPKIHVSSSRNISPLLSIRLITFHLSTFAGRERIWAQLFLLCPRDSCLIAATLKPGDYVCPCRMDIRSIPIRTAIKTL